MPAPVPAELELEVGAVAQGGWCVARYEGRVVFVRHALPGERVRVSVTEETRRFLRADAVEVLRASPDRVPPPCPYAGPGRCGGCDWQHARPAAQRVMKAAVLAEQLRRIAGIEREVTVEEVPGGTGEGGALGWRTRVRFAVRADGAVGLRRHRSHEIEPVDACLIAHPGVEELGVERFRWPGAEAVEAVTATATPDRALVVTPKPGRRFRVPGPVRARVTGRSVRERAAGREWRVGGGGFWQVHPGAAETLAGAVLAGLAPRPGERAVDLYCGAGLFTGVLGAAVGESGAVVGVESDPGAVADARHNLRDLPQVSIERGRLPAALDRLPGAADLVVADPPRTGLGREVVGAVAALAPRAIGYVSCDPATLARDLGLLAGHGYALADLRAFDCFPMTHHLECVAVLRPGPDAPVSPG